MALNPEDATYIEHAADVGGELVWGYLHTNLPIAFTSATYASIAGSYALRRRESPEEYGPYGYSLQNWNSNSDIAISFHIRNKSVWNVFQYRIIVIGI